MTKEEAIAAVLEWAQAVAPDVADRGYDYVPASKPKGLPDVVCELQTEAVVREDPDFGALVDTQQVAALRVWDLELSVMAGAKPREPADDEALDDDQLVDEAHQAASKQLRAIAQQLGDALLADETLGGRVQLASPFCIFDFTRPFVEYQDGTRGREMRMALKVAEPLFAE